MAQADAAVREAAVSLHTAIMEARTAGYVVAWPGRVDDLPAIAISATGRVKPDPAPQPPPVPGEAE